jgi:hypothetical protein
MAWFRCFINGENFPGQLIGEGRPIGFYLTRFVEANDTAEAESVALQALRTDPKLATMSGYSPSAEVRVFFEKIEQVVSDVERRRRTKRGRRTQLCSA